jgi:shikimate kinase
VPDRKHLILVGLPGSGKSTVGRAVAIKLGRRFLDFDVEIEKREKLSVVEIFAAKGEPYFRELERAITAELKDVAGMVLAPGGGWIANPGCLEAIRNRATLVYLEVAPERAVVRMGRGLTQRPLLSRPNPVEEATKLLDARKDLYLQSDHTVSTDLLARSEVILRIVALAMAEQGG